MFSNYNSVIVYLFVYLKHYSSSESPLMCSSCASIIRVSSLVFLLYLFGRMDPQNVPSLFWVDALRLRTDRKSVVRTTLKNRSEELFLSVVSTHYA